MDLMGYKVMLVKWFVLFTCFLYLILCHLYKILLSENPLHRKLQGEVLLKWIKLVLKKETHMYFYVACFQLSKVTVCKNAVEYIYID